VVVVVLCLPGVVLVCDVSVLVPPALPPPELPPPPELRTMAKKTRAKPTSASGASMRAGLRLP
jgi:hypothetical protein